MHLSSLVLLSVVALCAASHFEHIMCTQRPMQLFINKHYLAVRHNETVSVLTNHYDVMYKIYNRRCTYVPLDNFGKPRQVQLFKRRELRNTNKYMLILCVFLLICDI